MTLVGGILLNLLQLPVIFCSGFVSRACSERSREGVKEGKRRREVKRSEAVKRRITSSGFLKIV